MSIGKLSIRKLLMVSIVAMAAMFPLAGCNNGNVGDTTGTETGTVTNGDADNGETSNTTTP